MEGELLVETPCKEKSITEYMCEACSYYLSIGMSYNDYWYNDYEMVKYYRKAHTLQIDEKNTLMWLQGYYVYNAILDCSPVLNAMSKKHKPVPYMNKPIELRKKEKTNEEKMQDGIEVMKERMKAINKKFKGD